MADGFLETAEQEAKRSKKFIQRLEFFQEAAHGYPPKCPCGQRIVKENKNEPTLGREYLTCKAFKNDGLHIRKPWECAIEEEVKRLRLEVEEQFAARILITQMHTQLENNAKEIAQLKELVASLVDRIM